jgi:PAS domain-containing protein
VAYQKASPFGGGERIMAVHSVGNSPLFIAVTRTIGDALADWRIQSWYLSGAATAVVLMLIGIISIVIKRMKDHSLLRIARLDKEEAEQARKLAEAIAHEWLEANRLIQAERQQLDSALNNLPQGVLVLDRDG